jgi:hypothetical protein
MVGSMSLKRKMMRSLMPRGCVDLVGPFCLK